MKKGYTERTRYGNLIVYGSGNKRIIVDSKNGKIIATYNEFVERAKNATKRIIAVGGLASLLFSSLMFTTGLKYVPRNQRNLERIVEAPEVREKSRLQTDRMYLDILETYQNLLAQGERIPEYIDPFYIRATIRVESGDNPNSTSAAGARGLPQTYFKIWKIIFPQDSYQDFESGIKDRKKSAEFCFRYYTQLDNYLTKNVPGYKNFSPAKKREYLAAAYNCGVGNLKKRGWRMEKTPRETRYHIKKINESYQDYMVSYNPGNKLCYNH